MAVPSEKIARQIPYLRRYARALTGSQARGDEYVRLCLELIVQEPARLDAGRLKLDLFTAFHDAWVVVRQNMPEPQHMAEGQMEKGLAALPPVQRQALLLVSLEGFSYEDAAHILGLSEKQVIDLVGQAREEIRLQGAASILIIEDEPLIAMEISDIVEGMGHKVCGVAGREKSAVALARELNPALVLADIQLQGSDSGIAAVQEILKGVSIPVIFVTGFPERLLTGNTIEPAFVISKPFNPDTLRAAIGQALSIVAPNAGAARARR